jgi:hypothetical protein
MALTSISNLLLSVLPPAILLIALNFPCLSYRNGATNASTFLMVLVAAFKVITYLEIESPTLAYLTGLWECWLVIWSAVLLFRFSPPTQAKRYRWSRKPRDGDEFVADGQVWQRYPVKLSLARLSWTLDLLISFRGEGWQLNEGESFPVGKISPFTRLRLNNTRAP